MGWGGAGDCIPAADGRNCRTGNVAFLPIVRPQWGASAPPGAVAGPAGGPNQAPGAVALSVAAAKQASRRFTMTRTRTCKEEVKTARFRHLQGEPG